MSSLPLRMVIEGDCGVVLKTFPANSVDLVCTDPPYQLAPVDNWRHGMTKSAPKAGFMGKTWDVLPSVDIWRECVRVLKPGAFAFIMCAPRLDCLSQMAVRLQEAGFVISFSPLYHCFAQGFPKAMNISKAVDKKLGVKRERLGTKYELNGAYAGAQFKPALEVVIVAMKPLSEKTYVGQALKNGKGVTWLDNVRIPLNEGESLGMQPSNNSPFAGDHASVGGSWGSCRKDREHWDGSSKGRFPANLLVSDDALDTGEVSKASSKPTMRPLHYNASSYEIGGGGTYTQAYGDEGQFSRYFSLDAWWAERVRRLPESVRRTFPFLITPKASKGERNEGLEEFEARRVTLSKNIHPTVKALALMSYLVTLGSREGDVVLDPFLGSGTTAIACEMLARRWVGIELNREYAEIARARLREYLAATKMDGFMGGGDG